jgi:hypothetical protein
LFDFHSFFALGGQTLCKISEVLRKTCSQFHVFVIVRLDRRVADIGIVDGNIDAAEAAMAPSKAPRMFSSSVPADLSNRCRRARSLELLLVAGLLISPLVKYALIAGGRGRRSHQKA